LGQRQAGLNDRENDHTKNLVEVGYVQPPNEKQSGGLLRGEGGVSGRRHGQTGKGTTAAPLNARALRKKWLGGPKKNKEGRNPK